MGAFAENTTTLISPNSPHQHPPLHPQSTHATITHTRTHMLTCTQCPTQSTPPCTQNWCQGSGLCKMSFPHPRHSQHQLRSVPPHKDEPGKMICAGPDQRVSPPALITMATSDWERKQAFWQLREAPWPLGAALWGAGPCPLASHPCCWHSCKPAGHPLEFPDLPARPEVGPKSGPGLCI